MTELPPHITTAEAQGSRDHMEDRHLVQTLEGPSPVSGMDASARGTTTVVPPAVGSMRMSAWRVIVTPPGIGRSAGTSAS